MPGRRFNYTKRHRLTGGEARIRVLAREDEKRGVQPPQRFEAEFDLPGFLPAEARVFVEAYRNSPATRMRFDFGTVGHIRPPADLRLHDFATDPRVPLFRVKVTDVGEAPGRLLAERSSLTPLSPGGGGDGSARRGLLPVHWTDTAPLAWVLRIDDDGPHLLLDENADANHRWPAEPHFRAFVLPEVFRRVYTRLLITEADLIESAPEEGDGSDHWPLLWMSLPSESLGFTEPPPVRGDDDEKTGWIDDLVRHAAATHRLLDGLYPQEDTAL